MGCVRWGLSGLGSQVGLGVLGVVISKVMRILKRSGDYVEGGLGSCMKRDLGM